MNWATTILCNDYELLAERRIAFLMAWHKRLGKSSSISKHVPKDVGKLIGRKYMTIKSQSDIDDSHKPIILNSRDMNKISIMYDGIKHWKNNCDLIQFKYLNRKMKTNNQVLVESPDMTILFMDGNQNNVGSLSNKFTLQCCNENDPFVSFVNKFDHKVLNEIKNNGNIPNINDTYHNSFKKRIDYNTGFPVEFGCSRITVKVQDFEKEIVYIKSRGENQKPITYKNAVDQKYIGVGSKVKVLLKFAGVWKLSYGHFHPSWHVVQILVKQESDKFHEGKLMILDDNDY